MMHRTHIQVAFRRREDFYSITEFDPPEISCWWLSPSWLRWLNRIIRYLFVIRDRRLMESVVHTTTIDLREVLKAVIEQREHIEMIYHNRVRGILMGPAQWRQLHDECVPFRIAMPMEFGGPSGRRIFDMPVELVPWLDGVILLPETNDIRIPS